MAITLPSRSVGSARRRRGIALPTVVPRQDLVSDPGVTIPDPVDTGLGAFGAALSGLGQRLSAKAEKQRAGSVATSAAEIESQFETAAGHCRSVPRMSGRRWGVRMDRDSVANSFEHLLDCMVLRLQEHAPEVSRALRYPVAPAKRNQTTREGHAGMAHQGSP